MTNSKVVQHETVRRIDTRLAFETAYFSDPGTLTRHLAEAANGLKVLRPEFSANTGSALFAGPDRPLRPADLDGLWRDGGRVVVHDFVPGTPYFANGVVVDGQLCLTDTWRCYSLDEGPRSLLTAVVNVLPDSVEVKLLRERLQPLAAATAVADGPVCFEVVLGGEQVKVVKFAHRVAGAPLPGLCDLLGVAGQSGREAQAPDGFVADYAFTVRRSGTLTGFTGLDEVRSLPSYRNDLFMPALGEPVERTVGEGGGAAVLLKHADEATLLADVTFLQEVNRSGVFVVD
ncbi:hypothetical protein GQF42_36650 [Streptomyces broussonetiae]|uniref:Uncharacterized protein n=1 Tax=Streptomyces broussonetiae TaxID=2686304 RepID=A0A6I6NIK1_9ACTN|nr:hypothetical protein [Streptomyces broussonetiae]QHA08066.1 hypothetical protein GQF42_36650 [Streptomyces broussonetiae]